MELKNRFSEETKALFMEHYGCGDCGRSDKGIELHHIMSTESDSPLNCMPLCPSCHEQYASIPNKKDKWLVQTLKYLLDKKYELKEKDIDFFGKNRRRYLKEKKVHT